MAEKDRYRKNPELYKERTKAWRQANPEKHRKANREWAAKKRATDTVFLKRSRAANNKHRKANQQARQAATAAWISKKPNYYIWCNAKYRAKREGLPFTIKREDIVVPEFCPVLGIPIAASKGVRGVSPNSPSVDRIIPHLGYVPGNIAVISMRANSLKSDASADELELVAKWVRQETDRINRELGPPKED